MLSATRRSARARSSGSFGQLERNDREQLASIELTVHPRADRPLQVGTGRCRIAEREPLEAKRQPLTPSSLGRQHVAAGPPVLQAAGRGMQVAVGQCQREVYWLRDLCQGSLT